MSTATLFCADCGTRLETGIYKCPECGSGNKRLKIEETITITDQLHGKVKDQTTSGNVVEFKIRTKIAGESGNLAREELTINRRNRKETIKHHKVEEFINGEWKVVHEDDERFKAKRR
jgi:predicted  nucleic acid-binding Zn-ribbon protein